MNRETPLFLYEEILLLSLREADGTVETGAWYHQALSGAFISELLLEERIRISKDGKKITEVQDSTPLQNPLLDECLKTIAGSEKGKSISHWMNKFSGLKDLKHRAASGLCRRNILRADEDKVLLFFSRTIYPEIDPRPENELKDRMGKVIFSESRDVDARTAVLISLSNQTGLLQKAFDKKSLKERKERLKQIAEGDVVANATKEVIEAAQLAIVMVAIMPTIIST